MHVAVVINMDLAQLIELSEKVWLTGPELQTFVREEQENARAERHAVREMEKL